MESSLAAMGKQCVAVFAPGCFVSESRAIPNWRRFFNAMMFNIFFIWSHRTCIDISLIRFDHNLCPFF